MKINTKIRYGLRMLAILAENSSVMNTEILGKRMNVSPKYLRKLAGPMEKAHIIVSTQGKYGGYKLNKKPEDILISDIFSAYNENLGISGCTRLSGCTISDGCILSHLWEYFETLISREFFSISLQNIVTKKYK